MKIYIFKAIKELTDRYHSEGGAVVVAKSRKGAKELLELGGITKLTEEEYKDAIAYPTSDRKKEKVFIFPNAGCC